MTRGPRKGYSLQNVLMAAFLICLSLILAFVLLSVVPRVSRMLRQSAIERTRETLQQGLNSADLYVNSALTALHYACSQVPEEPLSNGGDWRDRLLFMRNSRNDTVSLAFFLEDGSLLYGTDGALRLTPAEVRQAPWFERALQGEGALSAFSLPHVQQLFFDQRRLVISLSRSLPYTEQGVERTGVMLMDIDYLRFSQVADSIRLGLSGYAYLMDEQGRLITHPRLKEINNGLYAEDREAVLKQRVGLSRDSVDGRERQLIISTLNQTRWRLVGVAYADEILSLQSAFLRTISVALAAAVLLSLAAASLMAFWVTRPIRALESKMSLVDKGELNIRMDETGFREIRSVSQAFNHMLARIRHLMDQVLQEQETKRLHELNALQAQINPHFLYNTLDSIIWMQERGRGAQAVEMVSALARLFRISISRGRSEILVSEELEHVRNYMIIQQMRFRDRFVYQVDCQEEAKNLRVIKLIIQPLVENAINHAMAALADQQLHIGVRAYLEGEALCFEVSDDGVGIPAEKLAHLLEAKPGIDGIGLKNVHERIRLSYGAPWGLEIQSVEDEGTLVTVRLPRDKEKRL